MDEGTPGLDPGRRHGTGFAGGSFRWVSRRPLGCLKCPKLRLGRDGLLMLTENLPPPVPSEVVLPSPDSSLARETWNLSRRSSSQPQERCPHPS